MDARSIHLGMLIHLAVTGGIGGRYPRPPGPSLSLSRQPRHPQTRHPQIHNPETLKPTTLIHNPTCYDLLRRNKCPCSSQVGLAIKILQRRWRVDLCWRLCFKTNHDQARFSRAEIISQKMFIKSFLKVNAATKSST